MLFICVRPEMKYPVLTIALFVMHFAFGESSHKHLHEDHYVGHQHNPEHDMDVLLGTEVFNSSLIII